jgi:hypothetical protein
VPTPFVSPASEIAGLELFLDVQREAVLRKLDGLTQEQATTRPTPSEFCMLTIVKHLAFTERRWVQLAVGERNVPGLYPPADPGEELRIDPGDTVDSVRSLYKEVIADSKTIIGAKGLDLDAPAPGGVNKRWVLLHMIEETARHAGHADILREAIDGVTGT